MLQPSEKEVPISAAETAATETTAPSRSPLEIRGVTFRSDHHDMSDDCESFEQANTLKPRPLASDTSENPSSSSSSSLVASTAALCVCMLTHSYLLISVFPYSGYMVVALRPDATADTAGSYAGWIAAAFMAGRAATSYGWGRAADCYGRTTVLYLSLGLSALCTLLFGLAPTFASAVALRFLLGASNGIMPTIKTTVSEMATNEHQETTMMSTVVGFWGWGFLLSPALSGALADPIRQYPHASVWRRTDGIAYCTLSEFPFLLPNLLGALLCTLGAATVAAFVRETLPESQQRPLRRLGGDARDALLGPVRGLVRRCGCLSHRYATVKDHESSEFADEDSLQDKDAIQSRQRESSTADTAKPITPAITMSSLWANPSTRSVLILYWAYSFVSLTMDEVLPLFCMSPQAGLGLSESSIGQILSLTGLLFAAGQYGAQQALYRWWGLAGAIRWGTALSAPTIFFLPLVLLWNRSPSDPAAAMPDVAANASSTSNGTFATPQSDGREIDMAGAELTTTTWIYLAVALALFRVFSLVFFSNISVAINRTVPVHGRATVNGLTVVGGSIAKGLGPIFAGLLVSGSIRWLGAAAALIIFGTVGMLGCGVVVLAFVTMHDGTLRYSETDEWDDDAEGSPTVKL